NEEITLKSVPKGAPASTLHSVPLSTSVSSSISTLSAPVQPSSAATSNRTRTPTPSSTFPSTSVLSAAPKVSFVNAAAFARACRLRGSQVFGMTLLGKSTRAASASFNIPDTTQEDLLSVLEEYRDFPDVFSK